MTHNPEVFEMEQQDLLWKRIGDVLWAHCLYLDVIWTEIQKKPVYLFFLFRPWLKIVGCSKGRLLRYTTLLAVVDKKEENRFLFLVVPEVGGKFNKYILCYW